MKDKILSLTKKLITFPTQVGNIDAKVDILKFVRKELPNFPCSSYALNGIPSLLFSNQKEQDKNFKIIFNAHLDVIPGKEQQYSPYEKDGKLYGRGAYDIKAGAAVMILLFKELADHVNFPLGLQLTTDEEVDYPINGTAYQIQKGVRGDFVVIAECNSNFKVGYRAKGRKIIKIHTKGKASHSAYAWLGKNAIWRMYEVLEPIIKAYPVPKKETNQTTVNITRIESNNESTTKIPDHCTAYLDVRYNPKDKNTIASKITALLPEDVEVEVEDVRYSHFTKPSNPYLVMLKKITKRVYGENLPLRFAHGQSDASYFTMTGCDAVEFGPIGAGAHEENEWVDIQSLEDYYQILKNFLLEIDKQVTQSTLKKKHPAKHSHSPAFLEKRNQE